ncbi:MAG: YfhO family protein [Deltaproteobacteria bacterium]|nr:YfhO family protein [Deltaproteobacteria bacterium]
MLKKIPQLLTRQRVANIAIITLILALPYAIFHWMLPAFSDVTIGNDYQIFPIQQQIELQFSLEKGEFPLYVPGFAMGHSATALTLGQLYHPVRVLAAMLPGYWEGGALTANTIAKLLGVGLVHLFAFYFFTALRLRRDFSFILSFIAVYNLRMLDMFRYGSSLENYLAYILVCVALGFLYLQNSKLTGLIGTAVATWLLCVGGHPQIMYLGLLGVGVCFVIMPFIINAVKPDEDRSKQRLIRFYIYGGLGLFAGIALAAVYILPFYVEFVKANAIRVGQDYQWSLAYSDSWGGALCNLFRPLNAVVTGAYGGTALMMTVALFPLAIAAGRRFSIILGITWLFTLIIFLIQLGEATPLHRWFWEYFPLANSFRVPGRVTMMMAMPMSLLLAWLFGAVGESIRLLKLPLHVWLGGLSILAMVLANNVLINHIPEPTHYIPARILELPDWVEPQVYTLGIVTLVMLMGHGILAAIPRFPKAMGISRTVLGAVLAATVVIQVGICMRWGTWVAPARETVTWEKMTELKKQSPDFFGNAGFGMELPSVTTQMEKSVLDPKLARFYRKVTPVSVMAESFDKVTSRTADEVVVASNSDMKETSSPVSATDSLELVYNTFNTLRFKVAAGAAGVMTVNYPFIPGFRAYVDGTDTTVLRANGYQIGINVPSGEHDVVIEYHSSASVAGMIVSLLTLGTLILLPVFRRFGKGRVFYIATGAVAVAMTSVFAAWLHATHAGASIETEYSWRSSAQTVRTDNIAFAKTSRASSIHLSQMPYYHYTGRAVDGEPGGRGWLAHPRDRSPYWQVDLGQMRHVRRIEFTGVRGNMATARRPLHIQTSARGDRYQTTRLLRQRPTVAGGKWVIDLDGVATRFLRIWAPGPGGFGLNEVEVFE